MDDRGDEPSRAGLVERVARAMEAAADAWAEGTLNQPHEAPYRRLARVAIEAMREPTRQQAIAGQDALDDSVDTGWSSDADGNRHDYTTISPSAPAGVYRAMISAALQEEPGDE